MKVLIGMIRRDELLNILTALQLSGGCDDRTLAIVAAATGLTEHFKPAPPVIIELRKTELLQGANDEAVQM